MMPADKWTETRFTNRRTGQGGGGGREFGSGGGAGRGANWKTGNGHQFEEEHIGRAVDI